jgi:hypothetical protein
VVQPLLYYLITAELKETTVNTNIVDSEGAVQVSNLKIVVG